MVRGPGYVVRQHANVDAIGSNRIPESFELGEVIENSSTAINGMGICYCIAYSRDPSDVGGQSGNINGCYVNGIASGLWYYIGSMVSILQKLLQIDQAGHGEDVKAVYSIPTVSILGWDPEYSIQELDDRYQVWGFWVAGQFEGNGREFTLAGIPTSLNGYTPRNQKLRQYPFQYLGFTPTNGESKVFRYEDFANAHPKFKLISSYPNLTISLAVFKKSSALFVSNCGTTKSP